MGWKYGMPYERPQRALPMTRPEEPYLPLNLGFRARRHRSHGPRYTEGRVTYMNDSVMVGALLYGL